MLLEHAHGLVLHIICTWFFYQIGIAGSIFGSSKGFFSDSSSAGKTPADFMRTSGTKQLTVSQVVV